MTELENKCLVQILKNQVNLYLTLKVITDPDFKTEDWVSDGLVTSKELISELEVDK